MIRAAEPHHVGPACVVTGQTDRLHDGFGTRHVEGHRIQTRDGLEARHVLDHERMIGAEDWAQRPRLIDRIADEALIRVVAQQIDAVGSRDVIEDIAVGIGQPRAVGCGDEDAATEFLADQTAIGKRHAVAVGEEQVGDGVDRLGLERGGPRETPLVVCRERLERRSALRRDRLGGAVGRKESGRVEVVVRDQAGDPPRQTRMSRKRGMLAERQLQAPTRLGRQKRRRQGAGSVGKKG